ncbi:alpha/beta hydrolase [Trinickia sp. NRRL B-1857]|uniref:alpha/beta fold hydrolase n=1 Tax=Trinickia sp. NRRL B-1857 TaxID=3162879 RepID=UPI003D2A1300
MLSNEQIEYGPLTIHAQSWGGPDDTAILALHGWLDNSSSFEPLSAQSRNLRWFAPDLLGHGWSGHLPPHESYTIEQHAHALARLIERQGWSSLTLAGHSLGAGIATVLAAAMPARVKHLVLIDALGPPAISSHASISRLLDSVRGGRSAVLPSHVVYPSIQTAIEIRRQTAQLSHEAAAVLVARDLISTSDGFASRTDRRLALKPHLTMTEEECLALLASVECPTLLIRASAGWLSDELVARRSAAMRMLSIVEVEGGHHIHMERPDHVADLVVQFLRTERVN